MPGTLVEIGLNSPRIPSGASGFMSHMSRWLGPPFKKISTQASARACSPPAPAAASAASNLGSDSPISPSPPICSICRRETTGVQPAVINEPFEPPAHAGRISCRSGTTFFERLCIASFAVELSPK